MGSKNKGGRMAYEGPIEDRLAIRERIEAYSDAVFRHDADAWIANWCEDAVWSLPGIDDIEVPEQFNVTNVQALAGPLR